MDFLTSLATRQKQGIAAVAGLIVIVVVVVLIVALSGGGDEDEQVVGDGTGTPSGSAEPTDGDDGPDGTSVVPSTPVPNGQVPTDEATPATSTPLPTSLPSGPTMRLTLVTGGSCDGNECFASTSSTFTLGVEAVRVPAAGYVLMQTFVDYGTFNPEASEDGAGPGSCNDGEDNGGGQPGDGADRRDGECASAPLTYLRASEASDEVVWADAAADVIVREELGPGLQIHGSLTGLLPPLPVSNATGLVVRMQLTCPATPVTVPISLLSYGDPVARTSGSLFVEPPGEVQVAPYTEPITLHCQ